MFLIIPLSIFLVSVGGIAYVVSTKFVYLKKLAPEVIENSGTADAGFFHSFVTEIVDYTKQVNVREHSISFLAEVEKILRKVRLFFLKIESSTSAVIERIRVAVKQQEELISQTAATNLEKLEQAQPEPLKDIDSKPREIHDYDTPVLVSLTDNRQPLREEEQKLIMAIAKSPRSAELYKQLGDIYIQTEELDDARQSFEAALELDPFDYVVKTKLARVLRQNKQKLA